METITLSLLTQASIEHIVECTVKKLLLVQHQSNLPDETELSTEEVCAEFNVTRATLNNYKNQKKLLPTGKKGKQLTYKRCDCLNVLPKKVKLVA